MIRARITSISVTRPARRAAFFTFFAWPMAGSGHAVVGQVEVTSFTVPESSLNYWEQRLLSAGVPVERSGKRFDEEILTLADRGRSKGSN